MVIKISTYFRSKTIPLLQSAVTNLNCNVHVITEFREPLNSFYDTRKPKNCSKCDQCALCLALFTQNTYFPLPCSCLLGSGKCPSRFQQHGYPEGPGKMSRLTKGVSISLPSSPLLPRQADIVPSQSCIRFTGG